jgi:CarboxypepD_reg-like domain
MKYVLFLFFFIPTFSFAQIKPTGKVLNAVTKEPIAGANVFITNTSYKTITDAEGNFSFAMLNIQKGELVVNALGYKHMVISIENTVDNNIEVKLEPQPKDLDAVIINSYEKDGYKKWGKMFFDYFIGDTEEALDCKIENPKVLKFYFDKKTGTLSVYANEPIKVKNKALGYEIEYTLESFEYNNKSKVLFYSGYPVFTEMDGSKKKQKKWLQKRNECYRGSIMHFMRSLYRNKISEAGFYVQKASKVLNKEKARLKNNMAKSIRTEMVKGKTITIMDPFPSDSAEYYSKIMNQNDSIFEVISQVLPADSFAFAIDSLTAGMQFEKHLIISYKMPLANDEGKTNTVYSFVKLLSPEALAVYQNGSYYNAINFFTEQYWAEYEKIARTLPFNFIYNDLAEKQQ